MPAHLPTATLLTLLAAIVSIAVTGFEFGVSNNVFHIPYVLGMDREPSFADDPFYGSLDRFTSWVWPLVRTLSSETSIEHVFFAAHLLSRLLALAAICWLFVRNGLTDGSSLAVALGVVTVTPWLTDASFFGRHGLFIHYFTHSEVTWAPLIAALVLKSQRRIVPAAAMAGIVFSINAFVGVWLVAMLSFAHVCARPPRAGAAETLKAVGLFGLISAPTAVWILDTMTGDDARVAFSYIEYIRLYFPHHFLAEAALAHEITKFLIMTYAAVVAALLLDNTRFWWSVLAACVLLVGAGVVLPYVVDARPVFNLHLLRVDGVVQFIAPLLIVIAAVRALAGVDKPFVAALGAVCLMALTSAQRDGGPILVALSITLIALATRGRASSLRLADVRVQRRLVAWALLPAIALCVVLDLRMDRFDWLPALRYALMALVLIGALQVEARRLRMPAPPAATLCATLLALCLITVAARLDARSDTQARRETLRQPYTELVEWIRSSPLEGRFLIPLDDPFGSREFETFHLDARRPVWVDWKQGAAVMWDPSFHGLWAVRFEEVRALADDAARIAYARANAIDQVVLESTTCPPGSSQAYGNARYSVCVIQP